MHALNLSTITAKKYMDFYKTVSQNDFFPLILEPNLSFSVASTDINHY